MKFYVLEKVISLLDCNNLIKELDALPYEGGTLMTNGKLSLNQVRSSSIQWARDDHPAVVSLKNAMLAINNKYMHYNIDSFESAQFAKYEPGGKYSWHTDDEGSSRKITTIAQLSNPKDYEGGVFEFFSGVETPAIPKIQEQGSIVVFDSRDWHRVTPVTKGLRFSLTQWSHGDKFV